MIQHVTLRNSGGGFNTGYSSRPSARHAVPSPSRDARHINLQDPLSKNINSQEGRKEGKASLEGVESMYRGLKNGSMLGGGGLGQQSQVTGCFHGTMVHGTPKHKSKKNT